MQQIDLKGFEEWLVRRSIAGEKHAPFYRLWVTRFLQTVRGADELSDPDRLREFSDALERNASLQDWQRQQAVRAAELYLTGYLKEGAGSDGPPRQTGDGQAGAEASEAAIRKTVELLRLRHYSYRTEQTYTDWIGRYLRYCEAHTLPWKDSASARAFFAYLAMARNVAASTQNQAFAAVLFLLREVFRQTTDDLQSVRARRGPRLPTVLSQDEVRRVLDAVEGTRRLMLELTYGAGLRVSETVRLRVKDLDFDHRLVFVRAAKGDKDRSTILPRKLVEPLRRHVENVRTLHEQDLAAGHGDVALPGALAVKYPNAGREWPWQYVFPSANLSVDPRAGKVRRHHVGEIVMQRAMRAAVRKVNLSKPASVHTLRHSFATHLLLQGVNIREIQEYLGHAHVETTMIYTHVVRTLSNKAESPLDQMEADRNEA